MCIKPKNLKKGEELDIEAWKKIIDTIGATFAIKPRIHISGGGEPLLYGGVVQLIRYATSKGFKCSMTTNGTLLEKYAEEIVMAGLDKLNVSVDGLETVHDSIRGVRGCYKRTFEGIEAIHAEKTRRGIKHTNPSITLNCVINEDNYGSLIAFRNVVAEKEGIDSLTFQHLMFSRSEMPVVINTRVLSGQLLGVKGNNNKFSIPTDVYPKMGVEEVERYYTEPSLDFRNKKCILPFTVLRIAPDGGVFICPAVDKHIKNRNVVVEGGLKGVWNDKNLRRGRQELKKSLSDECLRCCHREYVK